MRRVIFASPHKQRTRYYSDNAPDSTIDFEYVVWLQESYANFGWYDSDEPTDGTEV